LCEAFDVPGFTRSFEAMKKKNLSLGLALRLMLDNQDFGSRAGIVDFASRWEPALVDLAGPKVPSDCQQMRIAQQRSEFTIHGSIVTRRTR